MEKPPFFFDNSSSPSFHITSSGTGYPLFPWEKVPYTLYGCERDVMVYGNDIVLQI